MQTTTPSPQPSVAPVTVARIQNTDTINTLTHSIGVNGALLLVGLLLFQLLWNLDTFRFVTKSRLYVADGDDDRTKPPVPTSRWLRHVLWMRGDNLIEAVGLDAYFYLRFLKLAVIYFAILTAILCPILIPYNMSADPIPSGEATYPARTLREFHFTELSIGNIRNGSGTLWLHVAFVYVQAVILVVFLARECRRYAVASARHHLGATLTLQLDYLPDNLRTDSALARFVRKVAAGDTVVRAHCVRSPEGDPTPIAYVTFGSVAGATRLMSAVTVRCPQIRAVRAPLPDDLIWDNVAAPRPAVLARRVASTLLICFVIVFWTVPLTAIASINVLLPSFASEWQPLMQGVLPAWAFLLFLTLTPRVLSRLSRYEFPLTHSARHKSVFEKFTWVLFFDFFLFGIVSRGLIQTLIDTAARLFYLQELIASTIPLQSTSVIIYMLSFTCLTLPYVDLNQIVATFLFLIRGLRPPETLQLFPYGEYYSYQVLHILMGFTYATIAPLLLPFVLFYFLICAGVSKIQFVYVYGRREGCATLYPAVVGRTVRSAITGTAIVMSVLISKSATLQALCLIPILAVLALADYQLRLICRRAPNFDMESGVSGIGSRSYPDGSQYLPPWQAKINNIPRL